MSNMFHAANILEPQSEPYAVPLKYQPDEGYFWSFGEKTYYKDLKQLLIDSVGKPTIRERGQMVRKLFYTSCSYILLKIILEIQNFDIPKTFEIEETEKHYFLHLIYTDLEPLIN